MAYKMFVIQCTLDNIPAFIKYLFKAEEVEPSSEKQSQFKRYTQQLVSFEEWHQEIIV